MDSKDDIRETLAERFPPNNKPSEKLKIEKPKERKRLESVVTTPVLKKKKTFGKKMAETFLEDNTKSVGTYVVHDVLIPAAKSLICDIVGWGGFAEMLLFGSVRGNDRTRRTNTSPTWTSYGGIRRESPAREPREVRDISRVNRANHDFDELRIASRGEAENVLSHLVDMTIDYGQATVSDFYDLMGITSDFTDEKYGWTDLRNASVSRVRDGYVINLPRTIVLD